MRPRIPPLLLLLPLLLSLAAAAAGCSPPPPATPGQRAFEEWLGERAVEWRAAEGEAREALAAGEWDRAAAAWERRIALYPGGEAADGRPAGAGASLVVDLYNLACARARGGHPVPALDALEQALAGGAGVVGFDHVVEDPDLRPLHGEPRWEALVRRLSWNEEVAILGPGSPAQRPWPLLVRLGGEGGALEGVVTVVPAAPYREGPDALSWRTGLDRGERAAEKVAFAVERAGREYSFEGCPRVLVASGRVEVAVAWEVLLRRPGLFTAAVLDGPAPPAWALLDRGAEGVAARVLVTGEEGVPDGAVPVEVERAASAEAALAEALR